MRSDDATEFFVRGFGRRRAMVILRGYSAEQTLAYANAAWAAGLALVEVPLQNAQSAEALALCVRAAGEQGRQSAGAGTIASRALAEQAAELGERSTVAPGFDPDAAAHGLDCGMQSLSGVATATEVQWAPGACFEWLKAFPAEDLGTGWITAVNGPFPQARNVATGGISARNVQAFLAAGTSAMWFEAAFADLSSDELGNLA